MNMRKLFDTQKIEFGSTRRSPYHYSPFRVHNVSSEATRYSPLLKKTNRAELVNGGYRRAESTDEKQSPSALKPNKMFRIVKRNSNTPSKIIEGGTHYQGFPRVWESSTETSHLADSSIKGSPDTLRARLTSEGMRNRTCPTLVYEDPLKLMKAAIAGIDEAINKAGLDKEPEYFMYAVGRGNNDPIVKRVMQRRYWFKETYSSNNVFHFQWQPTSKGIHFEKLIPNKGVKQVVNHYEFHHEISTKIDLIRNLHAYCEKTSTEIFNITPTTFILDFEDTNFISQLQDFVAFFQKYSKNPADRTSQLTTTLPLIVMKLQKMNVMNMTVHAPIKSSHAKMQDTLYNGTNLWLLKPTEFNRGRGINLFNKLSSLEYYLKCFQTGESPTKYKTSPSTGIRTKESTMNLVKSNKFVVQKYLEKPMLIEGRKFDIRVWVLLDHQMNVYFFREGYVRLSSEPFTLNENLIEDKFVHLTNNAVQKEGKNYGKHESGNIISLQQLRNYLPKDKAKSDYIRILDRIKDIIKVSMRAGREKLNARDRKYCFEIFGFDFIIDQLHNVWLIEINTNPCLEESNELLKKLVPRMLDDAFKLTLDKIIVPTPKNFRPEDVKKAESIPPFSVGGYDNNENIWEHIANLRSVQIFCKLK